MKTKLSAGYRALFRLLHRPQGNSSQSELSKRMSAFDPKQTFVSAERKHCAARSLHERAKGPSDNKSIVRSAQNELRPPGDLYDLIRRADRLGPSETRRSTSA
jgi:hypothetical protein